MDDLSNRVALARDRLAINIADDRVERLEAGVKKRLVRRKRVRRGTRALGAGATLVAVGLLLGNLISEDASDSGPAVAQRAQAPLRLLGGSSVTKLDDLTIVQVNEATPERSVIELVRGGAHFDVVPGSTREFHVLAGSVDVRVVGTEFTVERFGPRVRVSVLRGRVMVSWAEQSTIVAEGETGMFPRSEAANVAPSAAPSVQTPEQSPKAAAKQPTGSGSWRKLAEQRKFAEARGALEKNGWKVPDDPTELLLAADVARNSQGAAQAVPLLRRMIQKFPSDPRASAAAFTLGKLLMSMGSAREAANAFARAGSLDSGGTISEDALAREVQAWAQAGDAARAKRRAKEYEKRYPSGLRLESVRRYGGL